MKDPEQEPQPQQPIDDQPASQPDPADGAKGPVSKPEGGDDTGQSGGDSTHINVSGGNNGKQNIGTTVIDQSTRIIQEIGLDRQVRFTVERMTKIEKAELLKIDAKEAFLVESSLINEGVQKIKSHNLLILHGESETTLRDIAILMANKLKALFLTKDILITDSLSASLLINLKLDVAQATKSGQNPALIFKNPTAQKNSGMLELLKQLENVQQAKEIEAVRACGNKGVFLIFTMSNATVSKYEKIKDKGFVIEIGAPDTSQRQAYL
ncbi:MAG: hypothetical protein AAFV07_12075, partial [Bacteroidota bacterium]